MAICRFLANEFGLAGKTNLEKARADMIVDCVSDIFAGGVAVLKAPADKKAELQAKYEKETVPAGMELLEKLLKQNGSKFFVGNCVSIFYSPRNIYLNIFIYPIYLVSSNSRFQGFSPKLQSYFENEKFNPKNSEL